MAWPPGFHPGLSTVAPLGNERRRFPTSQPQSSFGTTPQPFTDKGRKIRTRPNGTLPAAPFFARFRFFRPPQLAAPKPFRPHATALCRKERKKPKDPDRPLFFSLFRFLWPSNLPSTSAPGRLRSSVTCRAAPHRTGFQVSGVQHVGQLALVEPTECHIDHRPFQGLGCRCNGNSIDFQEDKSCSSGNPLVAVDERLSLGEVEGVSGRDIEQIATHIPEGVPCGSEGGIHKPRLPYSRLPAVFRQGTVVESIYLRQGQESWSVRRHCARRWSSSRCSVNTRSAADANSSSEASRTTWLESEGADEARFNSAVRFVTAVKTRARSAAGRRRISSMTSATLIS